MRYFLSFGKKELVENHKTYRLYILLAVFLLFGIMSPFFAKLAPELLQNLADSDQLGGLDFSLPEATALDAWAQFYKNISQLGLLALVIIFSGSMAGELAKGTLVMLLAKGLPRPTVILAKLSTMALLWLLAYLASAGTCLVYTSFYWEPVQLSQPFLALTGPWLFGVLLLALLILGGTVFASVMGSLLSCLALVLAFNLLALWPRAARFNPLTLLSGSFELLTGRTSLADFMPAFLICLGLILALTAGSVAVFSKKNL